MRPEEVEKGFRKLEPVMGDKAKQLWQAYLASEHEKRRQFEELLQIMLYTKVKDDYQQPIRLPPPPFRECFGAYILGVVVYPDLPYAIFGIREKEMCSHLGVFGSTGAGKTNLAFELLAWLSAFKKPFLVFDWKRNYRDLISNEILKDIKVFTVGSNVSPLRFNPLIPPPGVHPAMWLEKIIEIIAHAFFLGEGAMHLLREGINHVYQSTGIYEAWEKQDVHEWPTLKEVEEWLRKKIRAGREMLWEASVKRTLGAINFAGMGDVVNVRRQPPLEGLLNEKVVLELEALTDSAKTLIIGSLLLWIHHFRMNQGKREEFKHAIIIEEAHHMMLRQPKKKEQIPDVLMREIRELGESIWILDQHPSKVSIPALGNAFTLVSFKLQHGLDVREMGEAMQMEYKERPWLGNLAVGEAIVKSGRFSQLIRVRIPHFKIQKGSVSDLAVSEHMRGFQEQWKEYVPLSQQSEPARALMSGDILSPHERLMLVDIAEHPLSSISERYKRLGLNNYTGPVCKNQLMKKGCVRIVEIHTDKGVVKLMEATEKAERILSQMGVKLEKGKKESLEHEYWKHQVKTVLEKKGFKVSEEKDFVDLVAAKGEEKIALEIETGKSDPVKNLSRDIMGDYTKIIIVALSEPVKLSIEKGLQKSGLLADRRVTLCLIKDIERVLENQ